jgi:hypothetical protein
MKQFAILFLSILMITAISCNNEDEDADFVSQTAETKTAVLEEFTGVKCGFCPDGAKIAQEMIAEHPGKAIAIGIHGGSYSTPYAGDPDLSTTWASELISFSQLGGFPSGMVQRRDHDSDGKLAMGRGQWKSVANTVVGESAPVNVAIRSTYDEATNTANIKVQVYYTADGGGANLLNVAITQNGIQTQQSGDPTPNDPYTHKHVLRDLLTTQWGTSIATTTVGTLQTFDFTYNLKAGEIAADCEVVAYVTQGDKTEILNADICHMVNGEVQ